MKTKVKVMTADKSRLCCVCGVEKAEQPDWRGVAGHDMVYLTGGGGGAGCTGGCVVVAASGGVETLLPSSHRHPAPPPPPSANRSITCCG